MRKARSLTGLFEWSAVHSDVAEAVGLDRKLYGITKKEGRVWGNEALPGQSPGISYFFICEKQKSAHCCITGRLSSSKSDR